MKFLIKNKQLIKPLQIINNLSINNPTLKILTHLLIKLTEKELLLIYTNLEIEIIITIKAEIIYKKGNTTINIRKFLNICRGLP